MITDRPGSPVAADREITAELIDVIGILDRKGEVLLESAVIAVWCISLAVRPVDFEDGLAHQEASGFVLADGQAEKRVNSGCGLKDRLPQAPSTPCCSAFHGSADVAPEIIEIVLCLCFVLVAVVPKVPCKPPGAKVLDEEEVHRTLVVNAICKPTALRIEMFAQDRAR